MIQLEQVALRYGEGPEVLRDVNLALRPGTFVFLTGPSGAGKSSLLGMLALLLMPSSGRLVMFGEDVARLPRERRPALRRRIGVVFQDRRLLDHLSIFDNVALPLRVNGGRDEQIRSIVADMLKWLRLGDLADARPAALSMGQCQLVAIARAVITRPSLLLCDEPFSDVDDKLAGQLMHLFGQLRKLGTTVVLATHDEGLVERYRHPVVRIAGGRLSGPVSPTSALAAVG